MNRTIGRSLNYGFAGNYSRQPDSVISSHVVKGETPIYFGEAVAMNSNGHAVAVTDRFTADEFIGIATSAIQSAVTIDDMDGIYRADNMASVLTRGVVSVICQKGTPKKGGKVYVRIDNGSEQYKVGRFEATDGGSDTVELPQCVWVSDKDSNNIAEIRLKTINLV